MKHHGQYDLLTPEELGLNAAYYDFMKFEAIKSQLMD